MAYDTLYLSTVPIEEPCLQVGKADYSQMRLEAMAYAEGLRKFFGLDNLNETQHLDLAIIIRQENHDFGSYPSVQVRYDEDDEASVEKAFHIEANEPSTWEELGIEPPSPELNHLRS